MLLWMEKRVLNLSTASPRQSQIVMTKSWLQASYELAPQH